MGGLADSLDLAVFDALPDALLVVRAEHIAWANEAASALLGGPLLGVAFEDVLAPGERHRLGLLEQQREVGWALPATCRVRFLRISDREEITTDLRFGQRGDTLIVSARDVTDVTRAEGLMGTLAQTFARGTALLDAEELLAATEATFLALGWIVAYTELVPGGSITRRVMSAADDPVGDYGRSIIGLNMPYAKTPILAEVVRTGRPVFLDNLPTLLTGAARAATALGASMERAQIIRSAWCPVLTNGRLTHLLAVTGRDLTEHDFVAVQLFAAQIGAANHMQALRSELVHKERLAAVGEMAAVMAHEVRNPLGIIFNALAGLRKKRSDAGATPELLDIIHEEAERLRRLVTDLLDFSRPSAVELESVALAPLLRHAIEAACLDPTFGGAAKHVALEMPDELPVVETDPGLLRRALVNLLVNALQNVDDPGHVSLTVALDEDQIHLRIHNDGPTISPEVASRVFEPFFTTRASGTGLGLAVVRRIASDLGGGVRLEREDPTGTTFSLRLPVRSASPSSGSQAAAGAMGIPRTTGSP
ncbi:MAG: hypothetical protein KF764_11520 [Labilithrix sp.]|nr:hypothetical protein [Labilithrix sp.]